LTEISDEIDLLSFPKKNLIQKTDFFVLKGVLDCKDDNRI